MSDVRPFIGTPRPCKIEIYTDPDKDNAVHIQFKLPLAEFPQTISDHKQFLDHMAEIHNVQHRAHEPQADGTLTSLFHECSTRDGASKLINFLVCFYFVNNPRPTRVRHTRPTN